ncbi:MAG: hypothetical protein ACYDDQ_08175 [Vulcanimicrobiaceae bacterium]
MKKILASLLASAFLVTGFAMATASAKAGDPHEMSTKTVHAKLTPKPKTHATTISTGWNKPKAKPKRNAINSGAIKPKPKPKAITNGGDYGKHHKTIAKPKPKATHKP